MGVVILELLKISVWLAIMVVTLRWHKKISVDIFWLTFTSAILMIIASAHDICLGVLSDKSGWWLIASLVIVANYYVILRRSKRFYNITERRLTDFVNQIEVDTKKISEL